jgi:TonB family protein
MNRVCRMRMTIQTTVALTCIFLGDISVDARTAVTRAPASADRAATSAQPSSPPKAEILSLPISEAHYPLQAKNENREGSSVVRTCVNDSSDIETVTLFSSSGFSDFDEAALEIARAGSFKAATSSIDGKPTASCVVHRITFKFNDGTYVGDRKDGKRHGRGTVTFPNGNTYVGEFREGKINGHGTYTASDQVTWVGRFYDGVPSGQNTMSYPNGCSITGEYRAWLLTGSGTQTCPDGTNYSGDFLDGLRHGNGETESKRGDKYSGAFVKGNRHGWGTYIWANGMKYEGEFHENTIAGHGTMTFTTGTKYTGLWVNNELSLGMTVSSSGTISVGQFKKSRLQGHGKRIGSDGSIYVGDFLDHVRHGEGIQMYADGRELTGVWKEGALESSTLVARADNIVVNSATAPSTPSMRSNEGQTASLQNKQLVSPEQRDTIVAQRDISSEYSEKNAARTEELSNLPQCDSKLSVRKWTKCIGTYKQKTTFSSSGTYNGEFLNGKPHGLGTWHYPSGAKYEGDVQNGLRHGKGSWVDSDGTTYVGEWEQNKWWGRGLVKNRQGYSYEGEFKNNLRDGFGKSTSPTGHVYEGEWRADLPNGHGVETQPDGTEYFGKWSSGAYDGLGVTFYPNGNVKQQGWWEDGAFRYTVKVLPIELTDRISEKTSTALLAAAQQEKLDAEICRKNGLIFGSGEFAICIAEIGAARRILQLQEEEHALRLEMYQAQKAAYEEALAEARRQKSQRQAAAMATLGAAIAGATNRGDIAKGLAAATRAAQTGEIEAPTAPDRSNTPQQRTIILPNGRLVNCSIISTIISCY